MDRSSLTVAASQILHLLWTVRRKTHLFSSGSNLTLGSWESWKAWRSCEPWETSLTLEPVKNWSFTGDSKKIEIESAGWWFSSLPYLASFDSTAVTFGSHTSMASLHRNKAELSFGSFKPPQSVWLRRELS